MSWMCCSERGDKADTTFSAAFVLRYKAGVPDDLIKLWLGHSQNLIDLYAAQLRYDDTYRRESCERLVWDLSWANWAINQGCQFARPSSRKPVMRQVLEMVAGVRFELTTFGL